MSTIDAIFIQQQLTEKATYLGFIYLTKTFDRIQLNDVLEILKSKEVSDDLFDVVKATGNTTQIQVDNGLTKEIATSSGIWKEDNLSPILFNTIMDQIIGAVKTSALGYQ